jgi:hypothetical protein
MIDVPVNYVAVLVASIANMVLGSLWFGPLFGKQWIALMGWTKEEMQAGKEKMKGKMNQTYAIAFVGSLATAYVLSHIISFSSFYQDATGMAVGLTTAFWVWLGFVAPVTLSSVLWEGKPWKLWCLTNSYYLVSLIVMGAILANWI